MEPWVEEREEEHVKKTRTWPAREAAESLERVEESILQSAVGCR